MRLKNILWILSLTLLFSGNVRAQEEDFGLSGDEENITAETPLNTANEEFAEDEIFNTKAAMPTAEEQIADKATNISNIASVEDPQTKEPEIELPKSVENLSTLINQLNLSDKQLDTLKFLSDESRMRQEQLEKSIELFKKQAREIEEQNLREFEEVLTPEQKEIFEKIRALTNTKID